MTFNRKLAALIIRGRHILLAVLLLAAVFAAASISRTRINYDLTRYLSEDTMTIRGARIIQQEFPRVNAMRESNDANKGEMKSLQEKIGEEIPVALGIADHVVMTGNRDDVPEMLAAMDVFAFPSLWEGLPMTVVEAQAAGLPCVLSDTITKDVDVSPLVQYLPLGDPAEWADALLKRRPRQDVTKNIIRAGFDIRASAQRLSELYLRLDQEARKA